MSDRTPAAPPPMAWFRWVGGLPAPADGAVFVALDDVASWLGDYSSRKLEEACAPGAADAVLAAASGLATTADHLDQQLAQGGA